MSATVAYEVEDGIGRITLDRPRYRNAQSVGLLRELDTAFSRAREDPDVRVVVLSGAGDHFSAGHDLGTPEEREEVERRATSGVLRTSGRSWELYSELTLRWRDLPKPTIAQVQGYCIYAGWTVASAMDLVVAADDARFLPHLSEYFSLPWIVGTRQAKRILFENRLLTAQEALAYGMVAEVVPAAELRDRTAALARRFAETDPDTLRLMKAAVNAVEDTMGFPATLRTAQAYNLLAYHDQANASSTAGSRRGELGAVKDALTRETSTRQR